MKGKTWRKDKLGKSHLQSSLDVQVKWFGCDVPWVYCQLTKEKNKPCMWEWKHSGRTSTKLAVMKTKIILKI